MEVVISPSKNNKKKFDARIDGTKTVSFGQKGASDFTKHKDPIRKDRYIARHKKNEDHGLSGAKTAGFWSRHILWAKPTLKESIADLNNKFKNLNVKMK